MRDFHTWVILLSVQYAVSSLAAPPSSPTLNVVSTSVQSPGPSLQTVSAAATSTSPYYGYFRTVIGDIGAELPPVLTNAAVATKNANATLNIPSVTASLPSASTVTPIEIADYPINSPHRTINYTVASTNTSLTFHLANPGQVPSIDATAYAETVLSLKRTLETSLNTTGDRWLSPSEDPYGWDIELGCWMEFWSNPEKGINPTNPEKKEKQHLTLTMLIAVMDGLLEGLVYKGLYEFVYVEIWDRVWGEVGMGFVSPNNGTDTLSSVLDTLRIEGKR